MGEKLEQLKKLLAEASDISTAAAVLSWDQHTHMPHGGTTTRAFQLATLSRLAHEKSVSPEVGKAIKAAEKEATELDPDSDDYRLIQKAKRDYEKETKVPAEWVGEFTRITTLAHQDWEKAREQADYSIFQEKLEKIVELRREYAQFFAPFDHIYDPLLDDFERGMKASDVAAVFDELRPVQIELIRRIAEEGKPVDDQIVRQPFDEKKQWDFGLEVAEAIGFDLKRGRQDKSVHPFSTGFSSGDVRITTRFDPNFFNTGLFGTMHESGHAMYQQGINPDFDRTPLYTGLSLGVHESQSRMWENLIGRSRPFWKAFLPRLKEYFPSELGDIDLETFYKAINKVERSYIRVEADEATYNLHIMLRFELEMSLMEGALSVADLPEAWNTKFQEYLGLTPSDDALGLLQDIHWSFGGMGYFPTYALGNLIASQLWVKMEADIPDIQNHIEKAEFEPVLAWLRQNIHQHGSKYEPIELLQRVTGSGLSGEAYLKYLERKFGEIYQL